MLDKHYSAKNDPQSQKDIENLEDEEEDTVTYVLQMVTNGYNIKEKIVEANEALFSTNVDPDAPEKSRKTLVKFNDNPEKFEFFYGDYENETWNITIAEDDEDDEFLTEDELIALIPNASVIQDPENGNNINIQSEVEVVPDQSNHKEDLLDGGSKKVEKNNLSSKKKQKNKELKTIPAKNAPLINCREHCLEINSKEVFRVSTKPEEFAFVLPLHKRNCCKTSAKMVRLPKYNGKYSQYGLTQEQIDQKLQQRQKNLFVRDKNRDLSAKKQQFRSQMSEEEFQKWLVKKCSRVKFVSEVKVSKKVVKSSSASNLSFKTKQSNHSNQTPSGFHKYEHRESSAKTSATNRVKNPFQEITNGLVESQNDSPISLQLQNVKRRCGTWADVVEYAFIIN